jgi:hypothetical protein
MNGLVIGNAWIDKILEHTELEGSEPVARKNWEAGSVQPDL